MDKKKIIQILVIIGCFMSAGLIVYNGMFKESGPVSPLNSTTSTAGGLNSPSSGTATNGAPIANVPSRGSTNQGGKGGQMVPVSIQQLSINYDFSKEIKKVLQKNGLSYQTFQYPKATEADLGVSVNDLVKPMVEK